MDTKINNSIKEQEESSHEFRSLSTDTEAILLDISQMESNALFDAQMRFADNQFE